MAAPGLVLVTGASSGIGRAAALRLAHDGWKVALLARDPSRLGEVSAAAREAGGQAFPFVGSVTDAESVQAIVEEVTLEHGPIDALVNAAGTATFGPVETVEPDEFRRILETNLVGTFLVCRAVLPAMLARGSGQILNILSVASKIVLPGAAAYCAAKWGAYGFTRALALETRGRGVRVMALCPGAVDTPFWDAVSVPPERARMLRPEAVAETAAFMLGLPAGAVIDELDLMPPEGVL